MVVSGMSPAAASPAENVTPCSSAMPTSKKRSGNLLANDLSPVLSVIAAVTATTSGSWAAISSAVSPKTWV